MRLVTINKAMLKGYAKDSEMLQKADRPCALVLKLIYRGHRYDFAIPMRSNISGSAPKNQYFPLPPRSTTRSGNRHGLHYLKMFPVRRSWLLPFHTENNVYAAMIKAIIDKNEKRIVAACQAYLDRYSSGDIPQFSTDIDFLISQMEGLSK
jgi:hypothetical protein